MNTPETDSKAWTDHSEGILHEVVEASFARRLERERDEAREELNNMQDQRDLAMKVIARLERERDEAREKAERYRLEANAMMLQRDEAQNKLRLEKLTIISQKEEIELLRQLLIEARNK